MGFPKHPMPDRLRKWLAAYYGQLPNALSRLGISVPPSWPTSPASPLRRVVNRTGDAFSTLYARLMWQKYKRRRTRS